MTREEYYLRVLEAVRQRSTCDRGKAGALIVREGRIIATGYSGAPAGLPHCDEVGHLFEDRMSRTMMSTNPGVRQVYATHCVRTVHAELNAILQAAKFGIAVEGATMYCTMMPCFECGKAIINVGISEVIALRPYQTQDRTIEIFRTAKMKFKVLLSAEEAYGPMETT